MAELVIIKEGLPSELFDRLLENENVHYFSYITSKGGCLQSQSRDEYWIALTNKRVIYKTKVFDNSGSVAVLKEGSMPIDQITLMQTTQITDKSGCGSTTSYALEISSGGGFPVKIPIPAKDKIETISRTYHAIREYYQ